MFYRPTTQSPYHCVPACLVMILNRRHIKHATQEKIGYELGLVVPQKEKHLFKKVRTGRKPLSGYGTQVSKPQFSINHFFKKYKIPLQEKYYQPKDISDIAEFITTNLKKGYDIMACFNNKTLFGSGDYGHVCLVQNLSKDSLTLIDPERGAPKKRQVALEKLFRAMKAHGARRRGGLWLISG